MEVNYQKSKVFGCEKAEGFPTHQCGLFRLKPPHYRSEAPLGRQNSDSNRRRCKEFKIHKFPTSSPHNNGGRKGLETVKSTSFSLHNPLSRAKSSCSKIAKSSCSKIAKPDCYSLVKFDCPDAIFDCLLPAIFNCRSDTKSCCRFVVSNGLQLSKICVHDQRRLSYE